MLIFITTIVNLYIVFLYIMIIKNTIQKSESYKKFKNFVLISSIFEIYASGEQTSFES